MQWAQSEIFPLEVAGTFICNDSAALVEMAMRNATNIYPLTTTSRFGTVAVR